MSTLASTALMAGVATNGMTVNAYTVSRFPLPATDAAVPDGLPADAGPTTSATDPVYGTGYFTLTVPDNEPYYFTALGSDGHTYWLGPVTPVVSTTQQDYNSATDQTTNRSLSATTIAAGSNGAALPQATINVTSAATFSSSGLLIMQVGIGNTYTVVAYTGKTATTFTGCSGGSGVLNSSAGQNNIWQAWQASAQRRTVTLAANCHVGGTGDSAYVQPYATVSGRLLPLSTVGIPNCASALNIYAPVIFTVDPLGFYGCLRTIVGAGSISLLQWFETDS